MIARSSTPLAFLAAGPLADRVFNPLLMPGGSLAGSLGRPLGVGAGRGIGLFYLIAGLLTALAVAGTFANPRVRRLEEELPDAIPDTGPARDGSARLPWTGDLKDEAEPPFLDRAP